MAGNKSTQYNFLVNIGAVVSKTFDKEVTRAARLFHMQFGWDVIKALGAGWLEFEKSIIGIGKGVVSTVDKYGELQTSVVNTANVFGSSVEQVKENQKVIMDTARQMSLDIAYSAEDISNAMYYMGLAGMGMDKTLENVDSMLKFSIATGEDVETVVDLVTDSMTALGEEFERGNVLKYLDMLSVIMSTTNTNATQATEAIIRYGAAGKEAGMELQEIVALTGVLANRGVKDSIAGTSLNSMITRLTGTKAAQNAYEQAGVRLYDENGKLRNVVTILGEFGAAVDKMTDQEKDPLLTAAFGTRQYSRMLGILNALRMDNAEGEDPTSEYLRIIDNLEKSGATMEQMYSMIDETWQNDKQEFTNAVDNLKIEFGERFYPIASKALNTLDEHMPEIMDSVDMLLAMIEQDALPLFDEFLNEAGPAISDFLQDENWKDALQNAADVFSKVGQWLLDLSPQDIVGGLAATAENLTSIYECLLYVANSPLVQAGRKAFETAERAEAQRGESAFLAVAAEQNPAIARLMREYEDEEGILPTISTLTEMVRSGEYASRYGDTQIGGIRIKKNAEGVWDLLGMSQESYEQTIADLERDGVHVEDSLEELQKAIEDFAIQAGYASQGLIRSRQAQLYSSTAGGKATNNRGLTSVLDELPAFANGGIVTRPTVGLIGEAGEKEAVIPLSKLGQVTGGSVTYAPVIHVSGGNVAGVESALKQSYEEFKANWRRMQKESSRRTLA